MALHRMLAQHPFDADNTRSAFNCIPHRDRLLNPVQHTSRIFEILPDIKRLAQEYKLLTGRPLGVTGEVAEIEVTHLLGLTLADVRQPGFDAYEYIGTRKVRYQIKGRCSGDGASKSQRLSRLRVETEWDALLVAQLDSALQVQSIYEVSRDRIERALTSSNSKALARGALSLSVAKRLGFLRWFDHAKLQSPFPDRSVMEPVLPWSTCAGAAQHLLLGNELRWATWAWNFIPKSDNAEAALPSDKAHSIVTLLTLAILHAQYSAIAFDKECDYPGTALPDVLRVFHLSEKEFCEILGRNASDDAELPYYVEKLAFDSAQVLLPKLVQVLNAPPQVANTLLWSFHHFADDEPESDESYFDNEHWFRDWIDEGCPIWG